MKFTQYRLDFLSRLHHFLQWRKRTMSAVIVAALSPIFAHANPNGAQVISGQVSIDQSVAGITTITNSPSAIINWQDFNIAQNEITRFVQQNGQSAVLNRIIGGNPSEILGSLFSNGQVFLINPNGIVFGAGSQIDTQGLLASTLNLSNSDFQKGNFHFVAGSKAGDISNEGIIHAGKDGNIVLIAPNIENNGIIHSEGGKIVLAAGQELVLTSLDDPEIRFQVQAPKNHVLNVGQLLTEGGAINVFAGTLKHSGDISADSVEVDKQGNIRLVAKGDVTLEKDSKTSANNEKGVAGKIEITGENVAVLDNSKLNASGQTGGGEILIGGDWQGKGNLPQATTATVESNVKINANAITNGDGGKVVVWSDVHNPKSITTVKGEINAKGGKRDGDGGKIETSGHQVQAENAKINASAPKGKAGEWLLDPTNLTIDSTHVGQSSAVLNGFSDGTTGWSSSSGFQTCSGGAGSAACIDTTNQSLQFSYIGGQTVSKSFSLSGGTALTFNTVVDSSPFSFASTGKVSLSFLDASQNIIGSPVESSVITTSATTSQNINLSNLAIPSGATSVSVTFSQLTSGNGWAGNYGMRFVAPAVITNTASGSILAALNNGTNFTAQTVSAGVESGDIFVNSPILWGTNSTLTLSAHRNIDINSSISGFGASSKLALEYGQNAVAAGNTATYNVHAPVNLPAGQNFSTKLGNDVGVAATSYTVINSLGVAGDTTSTTLQGMKNALTGNFALGANIDAAVTSGWNSWAGFALIGTSDVGNSTTNVFAGKFDGLGHTISGLTINRPTTYHVGLFGASSGVIQNVGLLNVNVSGTGYVGGLLGWNVGGKVTNSYTTGSVSGSAINSDASGGLVGTSSVGDVSNSYSTANVSGRNSVGGLLGYQWGNFTHGISNSYSTGSVSGTQWVGGLLGSNHQGIVSSSYSTGLVVGSSYVGGLIGDNNNVVINSFWDTTTSGQLTSAGTATGLTTAQMMAQANFTGFDFTNTWWMSDTNTRPFLRSEWSTNVTNAHQLQLMASNLSANYTLANNLDLSAELSNASGMWDTTKGFVPVGGTTGAFTGTFDGLNHAISNLTINRPTTDDIGLFGNVFGNTAIIQNVGVASGSITGQAFVGGLVGLLGSGSTSTVSNSFSGASVYGNSSNVGGLVGQSNKALITHSYATGLVSNPANTVTGGLVGINGGGGVVEYSYATGNVNGLHTVGGLVGQNDPSSIIRHNYAIGNATATYSNSNVGGLVGVNAATISDSYSTGVVTGASGNIGGLVAMNFGTGTTANSFWDVTTSGKSVGVGNGSTTGATGLTTAQMKSLTNFSSWDFANTWSMSNGSSYPHLQWQGLDLQTFSGSATGLANKTFKYAVDGVSIGSFSSDSSGNFSVNSHVTVGAGNLLLWLSGDTNKAATLAEDSHLTGLTLEPNTIYGHVDLDTNTLKSAKGSLTDADIPFSFTSSVLTPTVGILKANNDIILNNSIATNGSNVSLKAGKSVLLNSSSISSNGGNIEIVANETSANGILNSHRDSGKAVIQMQAGSNLDAGLGVGGVAIMLRKRENDTPNHAGAITLTTVTGGNVNIDNAGIYNATDIGSGDVVLNGVISTNSAISTDKSLSISSSHDISVNAYLNTGVAKAGASVGNGGNLSLTAGNDILLNVTGNTLLSTVYADGNGTTTGNAGNITLLANRNITGANSDISASAIKYQYGSTGGHGGNVSLTATTGSVLVRNIDTSTFQNDTGGTIGRAGDVSITSGTDLNVNGIHALSHGAIYWYQPTTLSGGGNVLLDAGQNLTIPASGYIDTRTVNENQYGVTATINDTSGSVTLKAKGDIVLSSGVPILTSNDAVVLNSDSDATNGGAISLVGSNSITTNGGAITLGGGANATGYAQGNATKVHGIESNATLDSAGGDITFRGKSYAGNAVTEYIGIWLHGASSINSGIGTITLNGLSVGTGNSNSQGLIIDPNATITSSNTTPQAISLTGSHTVSNTFNSFGLNQGGIVQATNGGGITLNGTATGNSNAVGIEFYGSVLANSGEITLNGNGLLNDIRFYPNATVGYKAGTSVTASSCNITMNANVLNLTYTSSKLQSGGALTIQ
ncbi:MAG: filamentous hemagglutinin N-terminal domain-containing protein, partial [Methylococcales bacterium]|nr:filamentous hemagglutinin N-terminal domain-containing protein [Methylococcales bacterium]